MTWADDGEGMERWDGDGRGVFHPDDAVYMYEVEVFMDARKCSASLAPIRVLCSRRAGWLAGWLYLSSSQTPSHSTKEIFPISKAKKNNLMKKKTSTPKHHLN